MRTQISRNWPLSKRPRCFLIAAAIALLAASPARSQELLRAAPADIEGAVDRIVENAMEQGPISGLSVLVGLEGEVLVAKGYGFADLEHKVPATADTVYRLGSLSKQFTAAAVMQLADQGLIDLDRSIRRYLSDYPEVGEPITVRHLLNHTSGLVSYTAQSEYWRNMRQDLSHETVLSWFSERELAFTPGDRYVYSNSGYYLLGLIIESVTGDTFAEYVHRNLIDPLDLSETRYDDGLKLIPGRARGYERNDDNFFNARWLNMKLAYSAGAMTSSVLDLYRFHQALQDARIVSPEAYATMTTPAWLNDGTFSEYGMAFHVEQWGDRRVLRHGGLIFGFKTCYYHYPDEDLTIILLMNTEQALYRPIQARIARIFMPDLDISERWD